MGTFGCQFKRELANSQANNMQSFNDNISANKHFMLIYSINIILSV